MTVTCSDGRKVDVTEYNSPGVHAISIELEDGTQDVFIRRSQVIYVYENGEIVPAMYEVGIEWEFRGNV